MPLLSAIQDIEVLWTAAAEKDPPCVTGFQTLCGTSSAESITFAIREVVNAVNACRISPPCSLYHTAELRWRRGFGVVSTFWRNGCFGKQIALCRVRWTRYRMPLWPSNCCASVRCAWVIDDPWNGEKGSPCRIANNVKVLEFGSVCLIHLRSFFLSFLLFVTFTSEYLSSVLIPICW